MKNRKFNVLIIEDENDISNYIENIFIQLCPRLLITKAFSRDEAIEIISKDDSFFDYITLDLTLPLFTGSFEKNSINGLTVLGTIQSKLNGTPVLICTGTSTPDMFKEFLSFSNNIDVWGDGKVRATIDHQTKVKLSDLKNIIESAYNSFSSMLFVELDNGSSILPIEHDRLIRVFINKQQGCKGKVSQIGGGYSNARVYSIIVEDSNGNIIHRAICKCGNKTDIDIDASNYKRYINRLKSDATPRILEHLEYSGGGCSAVFYGLAENYDDSFFSVANNDKLNDKLQKSIKIILSEWHSKSCRKLVKVSEIRQLLINDDHAKKLIKEYNIAEANVFENNPVNCNFSYIHGDFHGENILLDVDKDKATLIDYGDIKEGVSILDPLTLECSFLFHKACSDSLSGWPSVNNINNWMDIDKYIEGCFQRNSIEFCRKWIHEISTGNREIAACLYSYALRQLKYSDTDKNLALKLISISFELYENS